MSIIKLVGFYATVGMPVRHASVDEEQIVEPCYSSWHCLALVVSAPTAMRRERDEVNNPHIMKHFM